MPASERISPLPPHPMAKRVARYVNDRFDGNLSAAAQAIGCSYDQLWRVCRMATSRGPSGDLLVKLAAHSGRSLDYWLTGRGE